MVITVKLNNNCNLSNHGWATKRSSPCCTHLDDLLAKATELTNIIGDITHSCHLSLNFFPSQCEDRHDIKAHLCPKGQSIIQLYAAFHEKRYYCWWYHRRIAHIVLTRVPIHVHLRV